MRGLLVRQGMEPSEADELLNRATLLMQLDRDMEAMECLSEFIPEAPSPSQLRLLTDYWSAVPLWGLRGHSDAELHPSRMPAKPKARPDGRCSCGSGKLYSRCCGRLN